jgi:hypothetical protein
VITKVTIETIAEPGDSPRFAGITSRSSRNPAEAIALAMEDSDANLIFRGPHLVASIIMALAMREDLSEEW